MPKITTNLGKELYFVKLPNFLSVDCKPFDPETYEDEIEDEENPDEEGKVKCHYIITLLIIRWQPRITLIVKCLQLRHIDNIFLICGLGRERLKLKVENTIRWRQSFDSEGKAYKESNARMVRYVKLTT